MKSERNYMKTSVSKREVSLPPVQGADWEVKIGCAQANSTEKRRFGTAKWLANPGGGGKITKTTNNSSFTPCYAMNNKSYGKSRIGIVSSMKTRNKHWLGRLSCSWGDQQGNGLWRCLGLRGALMLFPMLI